MFFFLAYEHFDPYKILEVSPTLDVVQMRTVIAKKKKNFVRTEAALALQSPKNASDLRLAFSILEDPERKRIFDIYGLEHMQADSLNHKRQNTINYQMHLPLHRYYKDNLFHFHLFRSVPCRCPTPGFFCERCRGRSTIIEPIGFNLRLPKSSGIVSNIIYSNFTDSTEYRNSGHLDISLIQIRNKTFIRDQLHLTIEIKKSEVKDVKHLIRNITLPDGEILQIDHDISAFPLKFPDLGLPSDDGKTRGTVNVKLV